MLNCSFMPEPQTESRKRLLDPVDRVSEAIFGLIMALTFTCTLSVAGDGRAEVRTMIIGALGCNLAWGIIDAIMYLMGVRGERGLDAAAYHAIRAEEDPAKGLALVTAQLPPNILTALSGADLERIRLHLKALPQDTVAQSSQRSDLLAAFGIFLLVFLCVFWLVAFFVISPIWLFARIPITMLCPLYFDQHIKNSCWNKTFSC